jgi:hypothetical protein
MNATGSVANRANDFGIATNAPPDDSIRALRDHIGSRSVGGRFVSWVKNSGGLTAKDQKYHQIFEKALVAKLGSPQAVKELFDELNFSTSKPLSARKIDLVMSAANSKVQPQPGPVKQQQAPTTVSTTPSPTPTVPTTTPTLPITPLQVSRGISPPDSQIVTPQDVDQDYQGRIDAEAQLSSPTPPQTGGLKQIDRSKDQVDAQVPPQHGVDSDKEHQERLDLGEQLSSATTTPMSGPKTDPVITPTSSQAQAQQDFEKEYQESVDPGAKYSPSALDLRSSLISQFKGDDRENFMAAHQVLRALNLKENEEITPEHAALAQKLVQRYEDSRGTPLHQELTQPETKFPEYFGTTFKTIVNNGWDPRVDLLTTGELIALNTYTGKEYTKINQELHGKQPMTPFTQTITSLAAQGLDKLPKYTGMTVRGTDLPRGADRDCVPGAVFATYGFTSSSATSAFRGTHQFVIHSSEGRDISFLSKFPKEKEIIFPPAHQFRVLDRTGEVEYDSPDYGSLPKDPGVATVTITLV